MYIYSLQVWAPILKGFPFKGLSFSIALVWILSKRDDKAVHENSDFFSSWCKHKNKQLSHKKSLKKLSIQNEVCYNNKGFVWDANMSVISFFPLLFSCLRVGGGRGITPSKVLVVDCKGTFFSTINFLSGPGIREFTNVYPYFTFQALMCALV